MPEENVIPTGKLWKLVIGLFAIALVFVFANVIAGYVARLNAEDDSDQNASALLNRNQIDSLYQSSIEHFDFTDDQISIHKYVDEETGGDRKLYTIQVPRDLPIPVVLQSIFAEFSDEEVTITAREKWFDGDTWFEVYVDEDFKLFANFKVNKELIRNKGKMAFIINDTQDIEAEVLKKILSIPEPITLGMYPSEKAEQLKDDIERNQKEFVVLINDEISEIKYKLSPEYEVNRLKISIKAICNNFEDHNIVLINENTELFQSVAYNFIRDEFLNRNYTVIPLSNLETIRGETTKEKLSDFLSVVNTMDQYSRKTFYLTAADFLILRNEIINARKSGITMLEASKLLK